MPKRSDEVVKSLKQVSKFSSNKSLKAIIAIFICGFLSGIAYEEIIGIGTWHSYAPKMDKVNICFTPPSGCGSSIIQQISYANKSLYVQAFNFYSEPIANALIKAKKRGAIVRVILDKTNNDNIKSQATRLMEEGIEVVIDSVSGIAHNKVMILDERKVITGSFNFSDSADTQNAENVLLIEDPEIAKEYVANWMSRYVISRKIR